MLATLGTLVLSWMLAQASTPSPAAPTPTPTPSASSSAAPSPAPSPSAAPGDGEIRRGPASAPRMIETSPIPGDATIVNSGSTNAAGYTIVVRPDASAQLTLGGTTEPRQIGAPQARWLFFKLKAALPLGALPGGGCMKSMSFGSTLTIAYAGQRTPDLSCEGDATTRELARIVGVIVRQLAIPLRPRGAHVL